MTEMRKVGARVFTLATFIFMAVAAASCGGGGDGGTTAPPPGKVARVDVTSPSPTMEVGQNMQVTVRYYDASSSQLTGKTVSYSTSNSTIATVNATGLVTAAAPGQVNVIATVDGVNGSLSVNVTAVPVFFIAITPANPSVRMGETVTLSAQPQNAIGQPIAGKTITWASANAARATITQAGVVTGVTPGTVYIRASTEGRTDSISLRVRSLITPTITGTSSVTLTPGGVGSITGTNFGSTIADNQVIVNGAPAVVTTASATSVTFTVPAKTALPCTATGPVPVALVANGDTALTTMSLRVATDRSLQVGQSFLLTADSDLVCNEYTGGGRYLITAFNYASHAGIRTSFRLTGSAPGTASANVASEQRAVPAVVMRGPLADDPTSRHLRAHATFMQQDRKLAAQLGNPHLRQRMAQRSAPGVAFATVPPPAVGTTASYRMRRTLNSTSTFDDVTFKVVYSGTKIIVLEDAASPLAGTMDAEYVKMGQEFDQVMYDQLLEFGDPLVVDSALDNNGRLLALFSPKVNNYTVNGVSNQVLGFVTLCDFFLRSECAASNEAEAFYALVPNPSAGIPLAYWRSVMRGTLIHEAKHIASYAYRYYFEGDVANLEETWLEEATAQMASEIWARNSMYHRGVKQDIAWADGPLCDYAPPSGGCVDPAEGILHHFGFLYDHYAALEAKSILDDPFGSIDPVIYGSSWSFARYVTDTYGASEPAFLASIVQVKNDHGIANLESKTGKPFSEMFGMFSLASTADNYPGATITDPKLRLASWNSRDLFQNMSASLTSNGQPAYPLPWPMRVRQVSFGNFSVSQAEVSNLRGGGWAAWELSGTQTGPQALAIRSTTGGLAPPQIGMTIVRIQ